MEMNDGPSSDAFRRPQCRATETSKPSMPSYRHDRAARASRCISSHEPAEITRPDPVRVESSPCRPSNRSSSRNAPRPGGNTCMNGSIQIPTGIMAGPIARPTPAAAGGFICSSGNEIGSMVRQLARQQRQNFLFQRKDVNDPTAANRTSLLRQAIIDTGNITGNDTGSGSGMEVSNLGAHSSNSNSNCQRSTVDDMNGSSHPIISAPRESVARVSTHRERNSPRPPSAMTIADNSTISPDSTPPSGRTAYSYRALSSRSDGHQHGSPIRHTTNSTHSARSNRSCSDGSAHSTGRQREQATPTRTNTNTATTASETTTPPPTYIDVGFGVQAPLLTSEETILAVRQHRISPAPCFDCNASLFCIDSAQSVICPKCRVVNPVFSETVPEHRQLGVGLGFTRETLVAMQIKEGVPFYDPTT